MNDTSARGSWTPVDTRDAPASVVSNVTAIDHTLMARSIAVQKAVAIAIDTGAPGPTPGDTLEYTLAVQVSDFFVAQDLVLADIVSDGQRRDPGFAPVLAITQHTGGHVPSSVMDAANATFAVDGVTGQTTATFRIGAEQLRRGLDDRLLGGCVPAGGTGVAPVDCTVFNGGATTVTVVYRTVIQDTFSGSVPSGDASVDHGDVLGNEVTASANLLSTVDTVSPTGHTESDDSRATITIVSGTLTKTIYAINGSTAIALPARLGPGDTVTYRLRYTLPSSDAEPLTITDYLPQPVLVAGQVSTSFSAIVSAVPPPAGTAQFGPDDTYMGISGLVPAVTIELASNSLRFAYPAFDDPLNRSSAIEILFTVTATDAPYADGLFLINHARVHEGSTNSGEAIADAVAQIILNEPNLRVTKGVVASSNAARVFAPSTAGPVTFNAPGTAGSRFSSTITSSGLASAPINSNVSAIDANDVITFAIAVENIGQAPQGAFDITLRQALPAGFVIPSTGLNLQVVNGARAALPFTDLGGDLFGNGIRLDDPAATQGALTTFSATSGTNIAIVTFDLQLAPTIAANQLLTTTATLAHYAGAEGGPDFTAVDLADSTTVRVAPPTLTKIVTGTDQAHTTGSNVVIGERAGYRLTMRIPEGTTPLAVLTDTLDPGLAVVSLDRITASPALTRAAGSFQDAFDAATIGSAGTGAVNQGRLITLSFGTITNSDTNNAASETIVIDYTVVVLNASANNRGVGLNNAASLAYTGGPATTSAANVVVQEPELRAVVTPVPTSGDADDPVAFTVTLSHAPASNAPAFEVTLADVMPVGITYTGASFTGGTTPATFTPGGGFSASWVTFPLGAQRRSR